MRHALRATMMALVLATGAAAAEPPPPPATMDNASVAAWIKTYIQTDGWTLIGADEAAVVLGDPRGVSRGADGFLTTQIRHEYYRPTRLGDIDSRSNLQTWSVDCKQGLVRVLDMAIFEENNLAGKSKGLSMPGAAWSATEPGSMRGRTMQRICEAPTTGHRLN